MPTFTRTQLIARPVEDVFKLVVALDGYAAWNPTIASARKLSEGPVGEGSRFEFEIKGMGKTVQELHEFALNRRVRLVPQMKMMEGGHRFTFTPEAGGTRVDHELAMNPKGIMVLMTPLLAMMGKSNLRKTADALQRHLESRPA